MSADAFYRHCREGGLQVTKEETDFMRSSWISTFREMKYHMEEQELMHDPVVVRRQFGIPGKNHAKLLVPMVPIQDTDEEDLEEIEDKNADRNRKLYLAKCFCGMTRANASLNAACNFTFQALVAYGAKLAGWNLLAAGYGDRLRNFVHDEYIYVLRPDELDEHIPRIEQLMLEGMRQAIPDVKIGVESSCCLHWDKHATEFLKLEKDSAGHYIIEDCEMIKQIKKETGDNDSNGTTV